MTVEGRAVYNAIHGKKEPAQTNQYYIKVDISFLIITDKS